MPREVKRGSQQHVQSEYHSGQGRKPPAESRSRWHDEPNRAQDLCDAGDSDQSAGHILDPGNDFLASS